MFFYASKLLWMLAQPSNLLLLLLVVATLALLAGRRRLGLGVLTPTVVVLVVVGVLPVGQWLALPLEERFPLPAEMPAQVDGIVVLGGAVEAGVAQARGVISLEDAAERPIALLELARRYPKAQVIFTGGLGWDPGVETTEAAVVRAFVRAHGLDPERVVFEDRSRNTYQNALFSKPLAEPEAGERWLLVTSAAHMPRSVGVFRRVGWPVIAHPVDYRTRGGIGLPGEFDASERLLELDRAVREWVGLVVYRLTDRTDALFPGP